MAASHLPDSYYASILSESARSRRANPIRKVYHLENEPGVISLLAGKPNTTMFPFTSIKFTVSPTTSPDYPERIRTGQPLKSEGDQRTEIELTGQDLEEALQYGQTEGSARLLDWLHGLQEHLHGRSRGEGWRMSVGVGSQDMLYKAGTALLNPGDYVLIQAPTYAGVIAMFDSLKCNLVDVPNDSSGTRSSDLRNILSSWPADRPKPKIFYNVPFGCNPTGITTTEQRKREIIELSREHDFIIFEDDPYFNLYFGDAPRPPSFFQLEKSMPTKDGSPNVGRVLRFDSFSKLISAGMRMGWVSGPTPILNAIDMHSGISSVHSSSLSQAMLVALFNSWGLDGFDAHVRSVSTFYRAKCEVFAAAMKQHLDGLAEWDVPEAGMFFWFKLLLPPGPDGESDSSDLIQTKAFKNGVLALPGIGFMPDGRKTPYVRAAFSLLDESDVNEALRRLRETLLKDREDHSGETSAIPVAERKIW
ncbi:PLP-dependent transferase [Coniophora puteana RWD-64-598 SS2]|uniref:PLP-dependent transferase n=1 Tax=Coniophora puteana (strain RWD-64-598) TaxID=741705 RepID=A0A5M3N0K5_CONPW|nr:PLP-dependent transferase [Coniophora puteana RWD-64-598 SS2]EIW84421.1 PLP-dependent transferase [Coniophora puteana RWD-64-598 SS2]